ncbi:hypothetical protein J1N35_027222 [Gossypium stocksii]|uniref:Uncharacterized protein n=1 Tax=Gossypium stocksii TaxID=47602 RepID=A0A9D3V9B4_9ROSI|nr:hypothetical protein J1N35_027222 [Gossypium stocksii]
MIMYVAQSIAVWNSIQFLSYSKEKEDQSSIRILPKKLIMHKAQGCILNTRLNVEFSAALTFLTERPYFRALQGFTIRGAHSYRQQGGNLQLQYGQFFNRN